MNGTKWSALKSLHKEPRRKGRELTSLGGLCSALRMLPCGTMHLSPLPLVPSFCHSLYPSSEDPQILFSLKCAGNSHCLRADVAQTETSSDGLSAQCQRHTSSSRLLLDLTECVLAEYDMGYWLGP